VFVALFSLSTSEPQVAPDGISFFLLRNEAHSRGMGVRGSRACLASDPLPLVVVVPDRHSLRLARNDRLEWPIVVKQEPAPTQGVYHAVLRVSSNQLRTVTLTTGARQDFNDDRGTYTIHRGQLHHLGTDHKTAWTAILSPKP